MAAHLRFEEVLSLYGLKENDLECPCPQELKLNITDKIANWQVFGRKLGISSQKIVAIERENRTEDEKKIILLDVWEQLFGSDATCLKLAKALFDCQRRDLTEEICKEVHVCITTKSQATPIVETTHGQRPIPGSGDTSTEGALREATEGTAVAKQQTIKTEESSLSQMAQTDTHVLQGSAKSLEEEDDSDGEEGMLWEHKVLLEDKEIELLNMSTDKMLTQLIRKGVFNRDDRDIVNGQRIPREKNEKIVHLIKQRGPNAFEIFIESLNTVDEYHLSLAEKLQPVRHRILWFTSSPRHAAAVTYCLEKYSNSSLSNIDRRISSKSSSYLLRRGRIFKRDVTAKTVREDADLVSVAQDVELYLAFPISERKYSPVKALRNVFADLGGKMDAALLSGVCVGVHGDSEREMEVRGGELVLATEAVTVDGGRRELPLSSALSDAKARLSELHEKSPPEWLKEAKERLAEIPNREHPRLVPHFDTIRLDVEATPTSIQLPRALAMDSDTVPFYEQCTYRLGVERPWFSLKSAISYSMLNNMDPSLEANCAVVSSLFAMEACRVMVEKMRQSQK